VTNNLQVLITRDLVLGQKLDIVIDSEDISTQNKKLDIYINTVNPIGATSNGVTPPVQTLLIGNVDLPVLFNSVTGQPNSAATNKNFNFNIDTDFNMTVLVGDRLEMTLKENTLLISNTIEQGDVVVLEDFFVGTQSQFDFSGQYTIESISGQTIVLDTSINQDFADWVSGNTPLVIHGPQQTPAVSLLSNSPGFGLNRGYVISLTRVSSEDNVNVTDKYLIDIRDMGYNS
jgi:hypothetical protein